MVATWSSSVGWGIFWIGLAASIIIFSVKKKFYPVLYLVSISLYIFTISWVIDVFDLSRDWILVLLSLSAIIMIGVGFYLARRPSGYEDSKRVFKK